MTDNVPITPGVGETIAARSFGGIYYQVVTLIDEAINHETDGTYDYYAFSPAGSSTGSSVWKVFRVNISTLQKQFADGNSNYDNVGSSMSGLSYS